MANEKHIFIGIGGQGCKTIAQIKEKVYEKRFAEATASKTRLQAMNDTYRFIFLDTDQRDIDEANKRNRSTFEQGKVPFISPQTDLINLGRANPHAVYEEAKHNPDTLINKRILEACSPELAAKIPDQPLSFGAGAFRIKSRIAFAHSLADFQSKLQSAVSSLNDVKTVGGEDCIIYYWLVSSSLGGTGSGIFNDVLYHINQIHHQVVGTGDPQLVYTMYMPKVFIDCNNTEEKYSLNAYGVFSELEAFKVMSFNEKQNTVMHRLAFNNDYNLVNSNKRYCPFYYLIPVDIQTDKGTSLGSTHTMIRNTAEMLFHLHNGQAGATFRSDIDNYMNDIMERDHKNFLVPMGYVSLQKPIEQFNKYLRFRFRRDILRSWLLCDDPKQSAVEESKIPQLTNKLFWHLTTQKGAIGHHVAGGQDVDSLIDTLSVQDPKSEDLNPALELPTIQSSLDDIIAKIKGYAKNGDKREEYKGIIKECVWDEAERLIRERGLAYAYNAVDEVRKEMSAQFDEEEKKQASAEIDTTELNKLYEAAKKRDFKEKTIGSNKGDIQAYIAALGAYIDDSLNAAISFWAHDLKRDFCADEKNCELTKLAKHIASFKDKAAEMNRDAVKQYKNLAMKFGDTAMDVTTVYLPMLKEICDGNGWKQDNFFSRLYVASVIKALNDKDETPDHKDLLDLLYTTIYNAPNEKTSEAIDKGQYKVYMTKFDPKAKQVEKLPSTRFFCNPDLDRSDEKIIEDFLNIAETIMDKKVRENKEIQEKWETKKISAFFADLTNDKKDEVRRSLNPALFFSYNSNSIETIKKEEHIVFVAGSEDLAEEMLGYQKGNNKHRFEKADSENTALVLKSKYGLSLADYRIYDNIKMVYDKASFREKYHFHHLFSQYGADLSIDNLPDEILPQHFTLAKLMLLNLYKEELTAFFHKDEYDEELYTQSLMNGELVNVAMPDAYSVNEDNGKIKIQKEANGHKLFWVPKGKRFSERFEEYRDAYYNLRFGETTETMLQNILRQSRLEEGKTLKGEDVLRDLYEDKKKDLLKYLNEQKKASANAADQRLYNILFNIVRKDYDNFYDFIKSKK